MMQSGSTACPSTQLLLIQRGAASCPSTAGRVQVNMPLSTSTQSAHLQDREEQGAEDGHQGQVIDSRAQLLAPL